MTYDTLVSGPGAPEPVSKTNAKAQAHFLENTKVGKLEESI